MRRAHRGLRALPSCITFAFGDRNQANKVTEMVPECRNFIGRNLDVRKFFPEYGINEELGIDIDKRIDQPRIIECGRCYVEIR